MKRLILMRHAKSSWASPGLEDHARPLNGRGRRSAKAIGDWLATRGYLPDQVLSSDSHRTRETWAQVATAFAHPPQPSWLGALYHAWPDTMLTELRRATGNCVMLLGHNPGCVLFAEQIVSAPAAHDRFADCPTAATLVAEFDCADWQTANWGQAQVLDFVVPRDLLES